MADDKTLISSSEIELISVINPFLKELDSLRHDITSIHSRITSFTSRLEDGEEIDTAALEAGV
jgi:hypothetical protein